MKTKSILQFIIGFSIAAFVMMAVIFLSKVIFRKPPKEITITKIEYKDSPEAALYKKKSEVLACKVEDLRDSLRNYAFKKIIVAGKTVYQLKDTFIHDTIYLLMNDIISYQDSIITTKDSIIYHLTTDLKAMNDSVYYFRTMYIDEKKKWRLVAVGSGILNILMFLKR